MRKLLCILVIISVSIHLWSQNLSFDLNAGYGTYYMKSLKDYQLVMKDLVPLPDIEAVESFPGYVYYSGSVRLRLNGRNSLGIDGAYITTGARNNVADYSGEYNFDMILNGCRLGLQYQNVAYKKGKLEIYSQLKAGILFSTLRMEMLLDLYIIDPYTSHQFFRSISFFGEPSLGIRYRIINGLSTGLSLGYQLDSNGKLHEKGNKELYLLKGYNEYAYVNWSGLRVSIGLTYDLDLTW